MVAKRSWLPTFVAAIFLVWGSLAMIGAFLNKAWDPNSFIWHPSDVSWAVACFHCELTREEKALNGARDEAQLRYEVPMLGTSTAWSIVTFFAALGLLARKNWARWLFVGLMTSAVAAVIWAAILFRSLRMFSNSDVTISIVLVVVFGSIIGMLLSRSIAFEFRRDRS
jgi:hypothetical protein